MPERAYVGDGVLDVPYRIFPHPDPLPTGEGKNGRRPVSNPSLTLTLSQRAREKHRRPQRLAPNSSLTLTLSQRAREKRTRPLVVKNIVGVGSKPTLFYNHARKNIRRGRRPCEARRGTRCVRPAPNLSLTLTLSQRAREI